MSARTIVITGASDGIGAAAARRLAADGAEVVLVGRDPAKTRALADELDAPYHLADYAELDQVRRLADDLGAAYPRIDVLANNAGGIMGARRTTVDGFEQTFQVNHLAGFLLTGLLLPTLVDSRASVVQTASLAARVYARFDIDDLQNERYRPQTAYGNAKLANILFTRELHRRYADRGIAAAAFHPGIVGTSFARDTTHPMRYVYASARLKRLLTSSPERGARQLTWLAEGTPGTDWRPGAYYERRRVARWATSGVAADAGLARRLWEESARLVGLDLP